MHWLLDPEKPQFIKLCLILMTRFQIKGFSIMVSRCVCFGGETVLATKILYSLIKFSGQIFINNATCKETFEIQVQGLFLS